MNKKGFTLVELLAVVAILGLVLIIVIPAVTNTLKEGTKEAFKSDVSVLLGLIELKMKSDSTFVVSNLSATNVYQMLSVKSDNYQILKATIINKKPYVYILGKNKWDDLVAFGGINSLKVETSVVTDGLVLNLDSANDISYSGTGTTWYDLSGNNYNGILTNGVGFSTDNEGAMVFDGADDFVNMGVTPALTPANITISAWVKADTLSGWNGIVSNMTAWGTGFSIQVGVNQKVAAMINGTYLTSSWTPTANTWYHVVATHNATTNNNVLYVNGAVANTSTQTVSYESNAKTYIGVFYTSPNLLFDGYITSVQIYNKDLSSSEVQQNYNAQKSRYGL